MRHKTDKHRCACYIFTLALTSATFSAHADEKDRGAWPAMRPLGKDIPANRGQVAPETQTAHAQFQHAPAGVLTLRRALELALMHSPELAASSHGVWAAVKHVCVDHGGFDILVTEKFLNSADIIARFKQVGSKAVPEGMTANFFRNTRFLHRRLDGFLQPGFTHMKTTNNAILFIR